MAAKKSGRPSGYKPEYSEQAFKLCLLGATDKDLGDFFGVSETTINNWKLREPNFVESLKNGKMQADANVACSLYKRALGYEQDTVKVFQFQGEPVIVPVVEKIAPDVTAQIFWLKNRQSKNWRDRPQVEDNEETLKKLAELLGNIKGVI